MQRCIVLAATLLFYLSAKAGYPFEKYPAPKYTCYTLNGKHLVADSTGTTTLHFTDARTKAQIKVVFSSTLAADSSSIYIYHNGKLFQKLIDESGFDVLHCPDRVYVGDLNNDSIPDIKVTIPNTMGCGLAGELLTKIYFISTPNGTYRKYTFTDFSNHTERDFDGDGQFEIIGMAHDYYMQHSYWVFDLYSFKNKHLVNVSDKYGYPIMIQHLYVENHVVTNKIPREKMREFSQLKPWYLDER